MQPTISSPEYYLKSEQDNPLDTVSIIVWNIYHEDELGFFQGGWDGYVRYYQIKGQNNH